MERLLKRSAIALAVAFCSGGVASAGGNGGTKATQPAPIVEDEKPLCGTQEAWALANPGDADGGVAGA